MREKRLHRILTMLQYHGDTFARIPVYDLNDVGQIGATLISSILDYQVSALLIEDDEKAPTLLATKGIDQDILSVWNPKDGLLAHLWSQVHVPTAVTGSSSEPNMSEMFRRLGVGEVFLVAPLNAALDHAERRIGLAIAARPRGDYDLDIDLIALDVIASLVAGAVTASVARRQLLESTVSRDYLDSIILSLKETLIVVDAEKMIIKINPAATELLGYTEQELIGQPAENIFADKIPIHLSEQDPIVNVEKHYLSRDGRTIPMLFSAGVMPSDDGKGQEMVYVAQDITERKRMEEALVEHALALEATNHELEAFSSSVAHDLRAPLRAVDGFSRILLEEYAPQLTSEAERYLHIVRDNAQKMGALIDDLLSLSRVSRREMNRETVDLSIMAESIAAELRQTQPERQIDLTITQGITAIGDPHLLRILLDNLFDNAWKFTGHHPQARIEFGSTQVDGILTYFVRDDGAGFDMAYSDKLFMAFRRLHTEAEFSGTGIGLATVQRIAHRHGGRVWAEGKREEGATFYFTLKTE